MAIFRTKLHWGVLFTFLVVLFACPLFSSDRILTILTMMGIAIISVHGLNILTGYCGQISIGHAGFMAVGGYTSAILCAKLGLPFWVALPCGAFAAGIAGLIFGGFMAVGGYTSAILCAKLGLPFWAALPCGALAGNNGLDLRPAILKDQGLLPDYGDHRRTFYHHLDRHPTPRHHRWS